jgi:hypothetical protein
MPQALSARAGTRLNQRCKNGVNTKTVFCVANQTEKNGAPAEAGSTT